MGAWKLTEKLKEEVVAGEKSESMRDFSPVVWSAGLTFFFKVHEVLPEK